MRLGTPGPVLVILVARRKMSWRCTLFSTQTPSHFPSPIFSLQSSISNLQSPSIHGVPAAGLQSSKNFCPEYIFHRFPLTSSPFLPISPVTPKLILLFFFGCISFFFPFFSFFLMILVFGVFFVFLYFEFFLQPTPNLLPTHSQTIPTRK